MSHLLFVYFPNIHLSEDRLIGQKGSQVHLRLAILAGNLSLRFVL